MRGDIEILAARGLIDGPTTTWPMPVGFFVRLREEANLRDQPEFIRLAAYRVLDRLGAGNEDRGLKPQADLRLASEPNLVRDFGTSARNQADLRAGLGYAGDHVAASLRVGTQTRLDGKGSNLSFDGSYLSVLAGNWQIYGGAIDKWWGPGWTSSLILSNNARPFPKIGITRNSPQAFETPWLSWLGSYQIDFFVGLLEEQSRQDRNTGVGALRLSIEPLAGLEISVSRVSEFCGGNNVCKPFRAAFGINNTDTDRNASNDEATVEIKYTKDFQVLSFSPYLQIMNEDTGPFTHSYESYLGGLSWAGPWGKDGSNWRLVTEYTDSRATLDAFSFKHHVVGAAYNNDQYTDGFRYRGRTLGFSQDSESTLLSLAGSVTDTQGWTYRLAWYSAHINTAELAAIQATGSPRRNAISARPVTVNQIEAGIAVPYRGFTFDLSLRGQDKRPFPGSGGQVNVEAGIAYRF
ncbi:MAG: capsule assembly Wzi family protein [Nevskia sp.]